MIPTSRLGGSVSDIPLHGYVAPGFGRVADAFAMNFTDRGDRGAACAIIIDGVTVVDVWAGEGRANAPWTATTRTTVFSVSKAVTALCLLMAADRGLLDLDLPVASYWPEFAAHGKHAITVRHALAHRAGIVGFSEPWDATALAAWIPIVDDLAAQAPIWEPDRAFAYHPVSVGFIAGEVLRRATGMRPSEWLAEHIAGPLALAMSYGIDPLDPDFAPVLPPSQGISIPLSSDIAGLIQRAMLTDGAYGPEMFAASASDSFLAPESPAANIVTSARDLARLFAAAARPSNGNALISAATLAKAVEPISFGKPFVGDDKGDTWGTGFMLHSARRGMAGPGSFGHDGAGGHLAFGQPALGLGFGYQTSQAGGDQDVRAEALCAALRESL